MPVNYFGSRFRKQVFGNPNDITYRNCSNRPNNYTDEKCVGCVCGPCGVSGVSGVSGCQCSPLLSSQQILQAENRRIYNVSRIPASEFVMNLGSFHIYNGSQGQRWNQSSDRAMEHVTPNPVPSHGNSTRGSVTRPRPGALRPGGSGVDIKHNSYARYLGRRKGAAMIGGPYVGGLVASRAVVNNKVQKQNSVNCIC